MIILNTDMELYNNIVQAKTKEEGLQLIVDYRKFIQRVTNNFWTKGMLEVDNIEDFIKNIPHIDKEEVQKFLDKFKDVKK